jgi:hypothetical protein
LKYSRRKTRYQIQDERIKPNGKEHDLSYIPLRSAEAIIDLYFNFDYELHLEFYLLDEYSIEKMAPQKEYVQLQVNQRVNAVKNLGEGHAATAPPSKQGSGAANAIRSSDEGM